MSFLGDMAFFRGIVFWKYLLQFTSLYVPETIEVELNLPLRFPRRAALATSE
jgi:hypothetical protein